MARDFPAARRDQENECEPSDESEAGQHSVEQTDADGLNQVDVGVIGDRTVHVVYAKQCGRAADDECDEPISE